MVKLHLWVCLIPIASLAQSSFTACDADAAIAGPLAKAAIQATDPLLPFEARMQAFRELIARNPADLFVNRAFLSNLGGYVLLPLYDRELPRYEALYRENPADPARRYLYAVAWQRRDPAKSAAMLEELMREVPDAPWLHL